MKRIDSVNARPDENGLGKAGFNDNADLPGQDATYVTPGWFNTVQEELCNLLELRGITLDPASKRQLYDLLTTQADLEALADEIETNFIRKNQIANNLTTDDATKVASARTVKELQEKKLDVTDLVDASTTQKGVVKLNNTLTSTSEKEAVTANQARILNEKISPVQIRACCTFNGSSVPVILFHDNILSITVAGATAALLKFTVTFIEAMPTKNYVINGFASDVSNTNRLAGVTMNDDNIINKTIYGFEFYSRYASQASANIASSLICFSIMC